jgi:hypothetical protein
VFPNKYSINIIINKKWLENQNDLEENKYKSPRLVYYKETNVMAPLVKAGPFRLHLECKDLGATTTLEHQKL